MCCVVCQWLSFVSVSVAVGKFGKHQTVSNWPTGLKFILEMSYFPQPTGSAVFQPFIGGVREISIKLICMCIESGEE